MLTWFKDTRNPSLTDTIRVAGGAYNLTGATVKLMMRSELAGALKVDAAAAIDGDPTLGKVRYDWAAADVDTAGDFVAWWRVTKGGKDQDTSEFQIRVLEHGHTAAWLCALADVIEELDNPNDAAKQTPRILTAIAEASAQICSEYDREFAPPLAAATRRFEIEDGYVDLAPHDLRAATAVTLHPEGTSPRLLAAGVDYALDAQLRRWGVYGGLRLARTLSLGSETSRRFGYALVDVAGAWGFAAVPEPARRACRIAVASWMRRDIPAMQVEELHEGGPTSTLSIARQTLALPAASHRLLRQFQRY